MLHQRNYLDDLTENFRFHSPFVLSLSTASWTELSRLLERRYLKKAWIWWDAFIYESSPSIVKGKTRISSSWSSFCDSDSVYTIVAYIKLACKLIVLPQAHLLICNLSRILYTGQILILPEHKCDHLNSFSIVCLRPPSFDQRFTSFGIFRSASGSRMLDTWLLKFER